MKKILLIILIAMLGGCASKPPESISKIPGEDLTLTRVRLDIDRYVGAEVRWGGVIGKVENKADQTWIEIVRQKLQSNGKPNTSDKSDGRFIASFANFIDPLVYTEGRPLTVVGKIEGKTSSMIGEYDYIFPIIAVEGSYLWKAKAKVRYPAYAPNWYIYGHFYHPWPRHHHHHH